MALHVEITPGSRTGDRGKELLQRIEDTFPTDGESVCRIVESSLTLAATYDVYNRIRPLLASRDWLQTDCGGSMISMKRVSAYSMAYSHGRNSTAGSSIRKRRPGGDGTKGR
jgi:hypothetical protein